MPNRISFNSVLNAAAVIAAHVYKTPVITSQSLDKRSQAQLFFKCEHLQHSGSFKLRGATNAIHALADPVAGVVAHSSGNHGAALALAAQKRGIACHIVVPDNSVHTKVDAIRRYAAHVHYCEPTMQARESICAAVSKETGAVIVHPYQNPDVIAGQGTVTLELLHQIKALDAVVVPVGGGGLSAGAALVLQALAPSVRLYLAEPAGAADASYVFRHKRWPADFIAKTICDGLRGMLGEINYQLLQQADPRVLTVADEMVSEAMQQLWQHTKQLVEPSSAITYAAVLANPDLFAQRRVGLILSGGNVDLSQPLP